MKKKKSLWRLYLGGNDGRGGQGYSTREIWGAVQGFVSGVTITQATGYWNRDVEESNVIEFACSRDMMLDIVDHLKKVFHQSMVMVVELGKSELL